MTNIDQKYAKFSNELKAFISRLNLLKNDKDLNINMDDIQDEVNVFLSQLKDFQGTEHVENIMIDLQNLVDIIDELSAFYEDIKGNVQDQLLKTEDQSTAHKAYLKTQYS